MLLFRLPLDLLSLVTSAKSFRGNIILGSQTLNRLGLHAARYLLAHLVMRMRWAMLFWLMPRSLRENFHRDGFVTIEDFLSQEQLAALHADLTLLEGDTRLLVQGGTRTQRLLLDPTVLRQSNALADCARDPRLKKWIGYAGGRWRRPLLYLQRIRHGGGEAVDPQKTLHSDTFQPTVKAWLFLEDVTADKGPFTYVPGSHRLTKARLSYEYQISQTAARDGDRYTAKGSLRLTPEAHAKMDLAEARSVTVAAGTLVIANTHGFHGRGAAKPGATRLELWAYSRHTPFLPWPGAGLDFWTLIEEKALHALWSWRDRSAEKAGRYPAWRKIDTSDLTSP